MAATATEVTTLETLIEKAGGPVRLLRSSNLGPYIFPGIPTEFTNFRDEGRSWKQSVALLEQSYHMFELHVRGPEAIQFLSQFSVNNYSKFPPLKGKQIVLAAPDGNLLADAIVFRESEDFFRIVGAPFASDWLLFQSLSTSLNVTVEINPSWTVLEAPRDVFRFQLQGPNALPLVQEVSNGTLPDIKFFGIGEFQIAGQTVRALRHGMAGTPGFEIYGPWDSQQAVRAAVEEAGVKYGLFKVGANAYPLSAQESGWMAMPLPAIYAGEDTRPYREWLSPYHLESIGSLGGSLVSDRIEDYYVDPIEVGYGGLIDWDRDFVGKEGLRAKADNRRRTKVTLEWHDDDVAAVAASALFGDTPSRYVGFPLPMYSTWQSDLVRLNGKPVGVSQWSSYSPNARHVLSLALVDIDQAEPGTELVLDWGEPDSQRATVDNHAVKQIRVRVAPSPYFEKVIKTKA
ncbi:aminomethyltransferase family protein [Naasia lichenicola]|uniref:Aminomethyl transferase family protein n=1 Tax=Naasia lichenicola TaxID=2565933 RepID=A0A4S4FJ43_9MICO|nr:aminomethyltransferase family protein [Naasia lichenicola]THG30108.1 aminomethyl transferase family protein [Naasia lichenicola]